MRCVDVIHYKINFSAPWYIGVMGYHVFAKSEEEAIKKFNVAHEGCKMLEVSESTLLNTNF